MSTRRKEGQYYRATLRLTKGQCQRIKQEAKRLKVSENEVVRRLLDKHLK